MRETVKVGGGQAVSYIDHGGSGPAVLLLHSYLMDAEMFAPQVAAFGDAFRLIAMDERGHGGTPADGPFTYWDVARDALGLLDALDVTRCAVVGTSQGGFIGLRMALLAPDRVTALALLGTSGAAEDPAVADGYRQAAAAWREHGPTPELLDLNAAICLGSHDSTAWRAKWRQVSADHLDRVLTPLVERDDLLDRIPEIDCPAVVLHGTADAAYAVEKARELADALPRAAAPVLVENGAHFLSLTDADAVNPVLREFLLASAGLE
ncbi:alpha/beta fold hydrolase [Nocardia blacklockiae]|uniref:alpha/beta fold hydrolase n=1 Tax=Nocardia blacklockiae TaxID=480036 RepID=UPI00189385E4|nr:alpha/beta hydrolase [Nocardia blacklockiae]MBF6176662.1 alpha/beta fold hydrolase [Nocardia blacklockiae]